MLISACGEDDVVISPPYYTVSAFLQYVQAGEYAEANELLLGGETDPLRLSAVEEEFRDIFRRISYEKLYENVNGVTATVTLTLEAVDFNAVMDSIMADIFHLIFEHISDIELAEQIVSMLYERMTADNSPTIKTTVDVQLRLVDNEWKIVPDTLFANALKGGWMDIAEYFEQWNQAAELPGYGV